MFCTAEINRPLFIKGMCRGPD